MKWNGSVTGRSLSRVPALRARQCAAGDPHGLDRSRVADVRERRIAVEHDEVGPLARARACRARERPSCSARRRGSRTTPARREAGLDHQLELQVLEVALKARGGPVSVPIAIGTPASGQRLEVAAARPRAPPCTCCATRARPWRPDALGILQRIEDRRRRPSRELDEERIGEKLRRRLVDERRHLARQRRADADVARASARPPSRRRPAVAHAVRDEVDARRQQRLARPPDRTDARRRAGPACASSITAR